MRQPIKVSPDQLQHRQLSAGHSRKHTGTRRLALPSIAHRRIESGQADAGGHASSRHAIEPEHPRTVATCLLARGAQQRLALKARDERPAIAVQLPKIAHPGAERGNRHAHKRAAAIRGPFPIRHRPIGIRQQHHIICNRSIHARHSSAPP